MAIPGDGTAANPYIVDNWADFQSVNSGSWYVKFKDGGGVIDFNDVNPDGYTTPLVINCHLDGNGWVWRNIYLQDGGYIKSGWEVSNLKILNLYAAFINRYSYVFDCNNWTNMVFSCFVNCTDTAYVFSRTYNGTVTLSKCSANIKMRGGSPCLFAQTAYLKASQCHFHLDLKGYKVGIFSTGDSCIGDVYNCLFTGQLQFGAGGIFRLFPYNNGGYNVYDITVPSSSQAYGSDTMSIYNSDTCIITSSYPKLFPCDSTQIKSASYLESIGFPIGV